MLAKTIPTERATMIAAMTMVRRLRNLRVMSQIFFRDRFLGFRV